MKRNVNKRNTILLGISILVVISIIFIAILKVGVIRDEINVAEIEDRAKEGSSLQEDRKIIKNESKNSFDNVEVTTNDVGVTVLGYHSIGEKFEDNPLVVSKELFREHLQSIKDEGYTTITLHELYNYLYKGEPIPVKSVVITFDDGYMDNYTNAFPILKEFSMNATIFIISDFLDGNNYMLPSQVKEMSDYGIDIQGHTVTHPELATLTYEEQLKQVKDSKYKIEDITMKEVNFIAYPYGSYNQDTIKVVEESGYDMAFTVKKGQANKSSNKYEIDRILIDYTYNATYIKKALKNK